MLYLIEFAVYGFQFDCRINTNSEEEFARFLDDLIDLVRSRKLIVGGGGAPDDFSMFVCSGHRYDSATEEVREAITGWLSNQGQVPEITVGEPVDANYFI
ncbi:50S ribosome-binding protein YggL [Desulfotalea psychrophila]|uniref:50S ribosome-binding protein YggL n=1 Tax=Desulfotalea psychrophila TaxID=84980 RepID=UPI000A04309F|nr:50S ribosome-binding protein YggL [Desulfotalea psychrophila]